MEDLGACRSRVLTSQLEPHLQANNDLGSCSSGAIEESNKYTAAMVVL